MRRKLRLLQLCVVLRTLQGVGRPPQADLRQLHVAGEKLFVDYSGHTMEVVDGLTGEVRSAQIFVAVLGASNYTYAEASLSQSLPDWIASHVRAFAYFGGVARQTVSDNLKAGITRACFHEPMVNRTYADLARHYHRYRSGAAVSAKGQSQGRSRGPNRRAMDSGALAQPPLLLTRLP